MAQGTRVTVDNRWVVPYNPYSRDDISTAIPPPTAIDPEAAAELCRQLNDDQCHVFDRIGRRGRFAVPPLFPAGARGDREDLRMPRHLRTSAG